MRPKAGQEEAVAEMFDNWWGERAPWVTGALTGQLYRTIQDPNELMVAVVFDSREEYEANAASPEQDSWYREGQALLGFDRLAPSSSIKSWYPP